MKRIVVFVQEQLKNKYIRMAAIGTSILVLAVTSGLSYAFASSPEAIRKPAFEHLHFRLMMSVDGKKINFADAKYQQGYSADNCNVGLTTSPIHFHDNKDQFVHIHWKNLTGGMVLKYYGLNRIGGVDGMLGTRFDHFPDLQTVPVHGIKVPQPKDSSNLYVYTGDEKSYQERQADDFLRQDLETFFNKQSNVKPDEAVSWLDRLFPKAAAHAGHPHEPGQPTGDIRDLEEIQNLLGNVVIFVQPGKPSEQQIKQRFATMEPLSDSACAG
jgi:hypothetical protein